MNLFQWLRAWWHREPGLLGHKPMPPQAPLPLRCPVHERPSLPLTTDERIKFYDLVELYDDLEARDPQEKP